MTHARHSTQVPTAKEVAHHTASEMASEEPS